VGDEITVNILGRDITATIAALREVDFSTAGIGFIVTMNPERVGGRAAHPYRHRLRRGGGRGRHPARRGGQRLSQHHRDPGARRHRPGGRGAGSLAAATTYGAAATLVTGFIVLIGAAAAGERGRVYEAAVLKTLGASRGGILASFALRSALLGMAAGLVAIAAGALGGWSVTTFVMDTTYRFEPVSALAIVIGGALATLIAGLAFAIRPLSVRPARVLRAQD
jgi:putative ABC transport system permease protein